MSGETLSGNVCANNGGALFASGEYNITGGTVTGNSAAQNGGGLFNKDSKKFF